MKDNSSDYAFWIKDLTVGYDDKIVLDQLSLAIKKGETFGLMGLNGIGKTTLIKTMLGLKEANSGAIQIEGKSISDIEGKKNLAYLPERFEPPFFMKGIEFLKHTLSLYGMSYDKAKAHNGAEDLALDIEALDRRIGTYSKGMRQKLGLLATFLTPCHNIILDEPMSGLDPKARLKVKIMLEKAKRENRTIFLSSHILADMHEICDNVAILHDKVIPFMGTPAALLQQTKVKTLEQAFLDIIENKMEDRDAA